MPAEARHTIALATSHENGAQWLHVLPTGTFYSVDGRGPYQVRNVAALITPSMATMNGKPLVVDYNHSTDLAAPAGLPSPAAGWITTLQARADGLWGQVEWTPAGRAALDAKEYRFLSPVFDHLPDGTVVMVRRASLVNSPNLPQLTALCSAGPMPRNIAAGSHGAMPDPLQQMAADEAARRFAGLESVMHALGVPISNQQART